MTQNTHPGQPTPGYESAERWNARYPKGTPVRLQRLHDVVVDRTAGPATQWGGLAVINLERTPGAFTVSALVAIDEPAATG